MSDLPRILIVDDEPDLREMLSRFLSKNGFTVDAVPDGLRALDVIGTDPPDLVLLDAMMPGLNGMEVLQRIRGRHSMRELPVIMVTARSQSSDVVEFMEQAANDYVTKPFSLPVLLARVKARLLDRDPRGEGKVVSVAPSTKTASPIDERYTLGDEIGRGHFGVVHRGVHRALEKQVAIKVFKDFDAGDEAKTREVLREGIAACRLEHPHALNVLDFGISSTGEAYLVMELLEGESAAALLFREGELSVSRALEIALPVAYVLVEAHARGIIHGDLKPENIFIHRKFGIETVKVVDFGVAAILGALGGDVKTADLIGTPAYMAPEIALRETRDGRGDVYALAVTLFELLTGKLLYRGATAVETVVMHIREPLPSMTAALPDAPKRLRQALREMLVKDPTVRPTAAMAVTMLSRIREG